MTPPFAITSLPAALDRAGFRCGVEPLDRYFHRQVSQEVRRRLATAFVATEVASGRVGGFYTLAATGIPMVDLPGETAAKLPRYPTVPAALVGRLAVDAAFHGRGLGGALLADALTRTLAAGIGVHALLVEAKDDGAADSYRHHGFLPFAGQPRRLFLPLATARAALG